MFPCSCAHVCVDFVYDVIRERRQALTGPDGQVRVDARRPAFLDLLLTARDEDGRPLEDDALEEETATFMFEGHGTARSTVRLC
jgi:cytochrome P450